ncbi:UNVERIFIED_CONTAM: hypothetical protein GTU68_062889 [Idotea baltica]|nr:hypothetical protein [Idotea baltica]
MDTGNFYLKS